MIFWPCLALRIQSMLLIRAYQNRSVKSVDSEEVEKLESAIYKVSPVAVVTIELSKNPERKAREATLTLGSTSVEIQPPKTHIHYKSLKPIKIQVILAEEEHPPSGVDRVSWLLLTTLTITGFDDVVPALV